MQTRNRANQTALDLTAESERLYELWKETGAVSTTEATESAASRMTSRDLEQVVADAATLPPSLETRSIAPVAFTAEPARPTSTRGLVAAAAVLGVAILGGSYALARARTGTMRATSASATSAVAQPTVAGASPTAGAASGAATAGPAAATERHEIAESRETAESAVLVTVREPAPEVAEGSASLAIASAATETETPARAPRARRARLAERSAPSVAATAATPSVPTAPSEPSESAVPSEPSDPSLPPIPARAAVVAAMSAVAPAVEACAGPDHGVADVHVVVAPSGRVSSALVTGRFAGTPAGSCIARAMRTASFPAFAGPSFTFVYPFPI